MIYSTHIDLFPNKGEYTECYSYQDHNHFEWKIALVDNGFFVGYFGIDYFKEKYFNVIINYKEKLILNSGCFFIQTTDFDTFYNFRNILKLGFTDDIWQSIEELIQERLDHNPALTEYEIK